MFRHLRLIVADPTLRMVALCTLSFGCFIASLGPYQSLIAVQELGLSEAAYSAILIAALIVTVAVSVGIGIVTDQRPSRRRLALIATTAIVAGGGIMLLGQSPLAFTVTHVLLIPLSGTLFGQLFAVARLVVQDQPQAERDGILAVIRALLAVPWLVVLPFWGWALSAGVPLISVYLAAVVFGLITLALILRTWPHDAAAPWVEVKSGLGFRASLAEMLRPPVLLRVQLFGVLQAGGALSGILVGLAFAEAGRDTTEVGRFFAAFVAIEVVGTLLIGWFLRFAGRLALIGTGVVLYAGYIAALPLLAPSGWVWALVLPAGLGGALIYALVLTYLADLLGSRAGAGASLLALGRIGQDIAATGSFWLGTALSGLGLSAAIGAGATLAALVAVLSLDRGRAR